MNEKSENAFLLRTRASHSESVFVIASGAGILFAGNIIGSGLRYLFLMIVARHMDLSLFGLFSLGFAVFSVAEVFATLGMNRGVLRFVPIYLMEADRQRLKGVLANAILFSFSGGICASVGLIACSDFLSRNVFHAPELAPMLKIFAVAIPFSVLSTVLLSATQGMKIMQYKVYVRDFIEPVFRVVSTIILFYAGYRLWGAFVAVILSVVSGTFFSYFFYRKIFSSILHNGVRAIYELKKLTGFVWPLLLSSGLTLFELWLPVFILGYYVVPEALGIFGAAHRTSLLAQGFLLSFNAVFVSFISGMYKAQRHRELEHLFKTVAGWVFSLSFPALLFMMLFSREILTLFGPDFTSGAGCLILLGAGEIINSFGGPLGIMIEMSGRPRITLMNSILRLVIQVALCMALIPPHGIMGAAAARTVSIFLMRAILFLQVRFLLQMNPFRITFTKALLSGGISCFVLILVKSYLCMLQSPLPVLLLGATLFLSSYAVGLCFLGFSKEDKVIFRKIRSKLAI